MKTEFAKIWIAEMMERGFASLPDAEREKGKQFQSASLQFVKGLQEVGMPEPADIDAAESELMLIVNELAAIQTALVSAARLMTLPPHLRDQIIIDDDGEMTLMEGSHQSARDALTRRTININAG